MKSETLFEIEGLLLCYFSPTNTFTDNNNGAWFHDPTMYKEIILTYSTVILAKVISIRIVSFRRFFKVVPSSISIHLDVWNYDNSIIDYNEYFVYCICNKLAFLRVFLLNGLQLLKKIAWQSQTTSYSAQAVILYVASIEV